MVWTVNGTTDPNTPFMSTALAPTTAQDPESVGAQVTAGWVTAQTYATQAYTSAQTLLQTLTNSANYGAPYIAVNLDKLNLDIAQFNSLLGTIPVNPSNTFAFTEVPYSSNLLTDLRARLLEWVDGKSTGLLPSVEQAIWDRGRAREVVSSNRKAQEAVRSFAMRGFSKPPGALSLEIQEAAQAAQDVSVTLSRDVMIKQADLEQTNRRFSFEQAGKMEEAIIAYTSQQAARVLESAKAFQQFLIDIYGHEVTAYGVETQAYAARVGAETSVFKAKSDVQIAEANVRVEATRVQLQTWIQQLTLKVEIAKAGATISAQLAAAALSSISVHAQMGTSVNNSAQNSTSQQASIADHLTTNLGVNYTYSGSA